MPRAHRHFIPGHVWHITHRCHGREFLLRDEHDRWRWLSWLRRAKKRYGFPVLGYSVTCNHIHLLAQDPGNHNAIARGMQLLQGSMAQEFNKRNGRINAFWGDRYHATAVEPGAHLLRCLAYIDLNMVRAGVVAQPGDWRECGYHELHDHRVRDGIVDRPRLASLLVCPDQDTLAELHERAIADGLRQDALRRDERWSESLAIGSEPFVNAFAVALGDRLGDRTVSDAGDQGTWVVREPSPAAYWDKPTVFLAGDNTRCC